MSTPRLHHLLLALVTTLPAGGCCTAARWFCGPDESGWVAQTYDTPEQAVATFREALRREDELVLYNCLSQGLKERWGLTAATTTIAYQRLEEEIGGVFMAGYAEVTPLASPDPERARFRLEIAGQVMTVDLVRQGFVEFIHRERDAAGEVQQESLLSAGSAYLPPGRRGLEMVERMLALADDGLATQPTVKLPPIDFVSGVQATDVSRVGLGFNWKVDDFQTAQPD